MVLRRKVGRENGVKTEKNLYRPRMREEERESCIRWISGKPGGIFGGKGLYWDSTEGGDRRSANEQE